MDKKFYLTVSAILAASASAFLGILLHIAGQFPINIITVSFSAIVFMVSYEYNTNCKKW